MRALTGVFSGRTFTFLISRADGALMRRLAEFVATRQLTPIIDSVFSLEEIVAAHERVERGHLRGKVLVRIA